MGRGRGLYGGLNIYPSLFFAEPLRVGTGIGRSVIKRETLFSFCNRKKCQVLDADLFMD